MNETQTKILKAAGDHGHVLPAWLGSDNARQQMAALVESGHMIKVDAALVAEIEQETMVPAGSSALAGDPQGESLRRAARREVGNWVLTPKGVAALNTFATDASGREYLEEAFIEFLFVSIRKQRPASRPVAIAEAEEIVEAGIDDAQIINVADASRKFAVPFGVLLAACKSGEIERAARRDDGKWYAPAGKFWAFAAQYHHDGR